MDCVAADTVGRRCAEVVCGGSAHVMVPGNITVAKDEM